MKNKRMKIARMECDMKQEDLAKVVGVTRQTNIDINIIRSILIEKKGGVNNDLYKTNS